MDWMIHICKTNEFKYHHELSHNLSFTFKKSSFGDGGQVGLNQSLELCDDRNGQNGKE